MQPHRSIASIAGVVLVILCASTAAADNPKLRREIEDVNKAMVAAFDRGDLAGVSRFYADDARVVTSGRVVRGRADLDAYWKGVANPRSWKLDALEVGGSADEPWQLGRSTLVAGLAGVEHTSIVDFIVLYRRQPDGKLKIYVDMYVSPPKPKP